jgi:hypothetical protein
MTLFLMFQIVWTVPIKIKKMPKGVDHKKITKHPNEQNWLMKNEDLSTI